MPADHPRTRSRPRARAGAGRTAAQSFIGLTVGAAVVYALLWALDLGGEPDAPSLFALWSSPVAADMLANLGEVTVALLGIALTVVAILVQLAAYRYTPRITELFVRDPVNMAALGVFVITAVLVLWVNMTLEAITGPSLMVLALVVGVSICILGLIPYFAYIFAFLSPGHIVRLIEGEAVRTLHRLRRRGEAGVARARRDLLTSLEHLDDMSQSAVKKDDKAIAIRCLAALADVLTAHAAVKDQLPDAWFSTAELARRDPDFVALDADMIRSLEARRTWVEMKVLRGLELIFRHALKRLTDVNHLIAVHLRRVAEAAASRGDAPVTRLAQRYFNTFLRLAINAGDVRSAYNVVMEYRELARSLMEAGHHAEVVRIAEHLKYYAHVAFAAGHPLVVETIAHDLGDLLELAHDLGASCHDEVLGVLLEIDREPYEDLAHQEASLRGVRKAQVRLATYYLEVGAEPLARRIYEDMREERPARLRSIWAELSQLDDPEWWEVANRDANWDYLPPRRRGQLGAFFGWFPGL